MGLGWKSLQALILRAPLCGANNNTAKFPETLRFHSRSKHKGMICYFDQCNCTVKSYESFHYHMGSKHKKSCIIVTNATTKQKHLEPFVTTSNLNTKIPYIIHMLNAQQTNKCKNNHTTELYPYPQKSQFFCSGPVNLVKHMKMETEDLHSDMPWFIFLIECSCSKDWRRDIQCAACAVWNRQCGLEKHASLATALLPFMALTASPLGTTHPTLPQLHRCPHTAAFAAIDSITS